MGISATTMTTILRVAGTFIEVDPNTSFKLVGGHRDGGPLIVHSTTRIEYFARSTFM